LRAARMSTWSTTLSMASLQACEWSSKQLTPQFDWRLLLWNQA
jgi:hypothetical protein